MIKLGEAPIIQVPMIDYGFLTISNEKQEAYRESIFHLNENARKSLSDGFSFDSDGTLQGSNSFLPIWLAQNNLLSENEFLLSIAQFSRAFNSNPNSFANTYQDTGIILRTNGDKIERNNYLAKNLFSKLKKRGFLATPEKPVVISLSDFKKLEESSKSGYGLLYDLAEDAKPIITPEYGTKEKTERFDIYDERGIPILKKNGKYKIWKKSSGVRSVYSNYGQGAYSNYGGLADSDSVGRVGVGGSNVPQNIIQIKKEIKQEELRKKEWTEKIGQNLESRLAKLIN